jgi:hypothetical protein
MVLLNHYDRLKYNQLISFEYRAKNDVKRLKISNKELNVSLLSFYSLMKVSVLRMTGQEIYYRD